LAVAQGYTELEFLSKIIQACRLKPLPLLIGDKYKLQLYREWIDEFKNSLHLLKKKRTEIVYNDLEIPHVISSDLYYGLDLIKIAKISKITYLIIGHDEDLGQPYIIITFLGIDGYLRSYLNMYGEWHIISPLFLGIVRLQEIFRKLDIKYFHKLNYKKNNMIPCQGVGEWITCLPAPEELLIELKKKYDIDFSSLLNKENING
jgi:hypothetical protein